MSQTHTYTQDQIHTLPLEINAAQIIFLSGDLGAGKTTLSQHIIKNICGVSESVTSPTYTYYNHYVSDTYGDIYHFDLYRLENYDEFFAIGAEEIFDNNTGIILVEWPELIADHYEADLSIFIEKTAQEDMRIVHIR